MKKFKLPEIKKERNKKPVKKPNEKTLNTLYNIGLVMMFFGFGVSTFQLIFNLCGYKFIPELALAGVVLSFVGMVLYTVCNQKLHLLEFKMLNNTCEREVSILKSVYNTKLKESSEQVNLDDSTRKTALFVTLYNFLNKAGYIYEHADLLKLVDKCINNMKNCIDDPSKLDI